MVGLKRNSRGLVSQRTLFLLAVTNATDFRSTKRLTVGIPTNSCRRTLATGAMT